MPVLPHVRVLSKPPPPSPAKRSTACRATRAAVAILAAPSPRVGGREGGEPPGCSKTHQASRNGQRQGVGERGTAAYGGGGGLVLVGAAAFFCCAMRTTRQPGCPPAPEECVSCLDGGGSGVGSRTALRSKQRGSGLSVAQARWAGSGILRTTAPCAIFLLRAE